jgi:pimeloyl-ACP methyl ester carboxylesterase
MQQTIQIKTGASQSEVIQYGNEQHVPLVFFHGLGASAACIRPNPIQLTQLGIYILAVNRPGTGQSNFFLPTSLTGYLAHIIQLLDQLAVSNAHVVGWSAGGLYAQALAVHYPERVRSLTLINSAIPFYNPSSRPILPAKWRFISTLNWLLPQAAQFLPDRREAARAQTQPALPASAARVRKGDRSFCE